MSELERSLLRRLRDRDERAFRELLEAHRDRVFNITFRMLGNRAEAEDVAQEVFITVFKTIETFREESKFSTWLYRVAVNHCKNRIKYLARRHDRDRDELDETVERRRTAPIGAPPPRAPDRALEGAQMEKLLQEAIAELDEDQRIVVVLRDVEDLSIEEICEITGLPDGTVKSRLHRARLVLRKKLPAPRWRADMSESDETTTRSSSRSPTISTARSPRAEKAEVAQKIASDPAWKRAHDEMVGETSQRSSRGCRRRARRRRSPRTSPTTIHKRSAGRFFARRTFGDRVPFVRAARSSRCSGCA